MLVKLLIANRGEIACRVIRTAKRMGIHTVALYSDADANALHVQMADEAVHIGPAPSKESYLQAERIIEVAKKVGADMIHPGYGFLSENANFARLCEDNQIIFVGPPVAAIDAMGSKSAAKKIMETAGVPLVPGYHGDNQDAVFLKQQADAMGYPVLLKAAAGGGGKGMRQVWKAEEFEQALAGAKREAINSFGDDKMLVEKYLTQPRHVEIQVFCDMHGNGVYLFERDCSVQRRHQKVIEEAPAPGMSESLRQQMGEAALKAAAAIHYVGAGTVEFLLDTDGSFYFMEMNTRLQVEHPVTEMITGQDLVEWQLRVASGEELPLKQDELRIDGHAFEARVYAEDPDNEFLPATGTLHLLQPPEESDYVRVDTGVRQGDKVSVYYDPMIAKLIVWDEDRNKALRRLAKALSEYRIKGVTTNIDFLYNLATTKAFKQAELDTGFIGKHQSEIFLKNDQDIRELLPLAALYLLLSEEHGHHSHSSSHQDPFSPWSSQIAWRANETHVQKMDIQIHDEVYALEIRQQGMGQHSRYQISHGSLTVDAFGELIGDKLVATVDGHRLTAQCSGDGLECSLYSQHGALHFSRKLPDYGLKDDSQSAAGFKAPMNGTVVALLVNPGDKVEKGQVLMVMEAMKMEHSLKAHAAGMVSEFYYQPGDLVDGGAELLKFDASQP
ncbi:acetyl/propionyl/methylcrotonyl-CoA carboxylase subunit alpha [Aliiglaciecola sp. CAU 1673]|uniref:acetyl/propionyl/methylcrotonyl-CoA carboxylase subunit alpha n=1 Tax=Aliiglaciecola sp. CAU 1673 TaxID=3032595 RepID=UPI0023DBBC5A|nr:acetyl/propionyl/methylcrotonyl-CoA carboxylase subunit alpha [Aliiglaciecola sp. CAU 1673]MDF2179953.1 acetyl/propionyl/methylcrotonyl-CoA carboxylase subunit alpha [Aliiglaciecola sp. CAU 1673]